MLKTNLPNGAARFLAREVEVFGVLIIGASLVIRFVLVKFCAKSMRFLRSRSASRSGGERWNGYCFVQTKSGHAQFLSEFRYVIPIGSAHSFEQSVDAQPLDESADLSRAATFEQGSQSPITESAGREFPTQDGNKQGALLDTQQVKTAVAPLVSIFLGFSQTIEFVLRAAVLAQRAKPLKVPAQSRQHDYAK